MCTRQRVHRAQAAECLSSRRLGGVPQSCWGVERSQPPAPLGETSPLLQGDPARRHRRPRRVAGAPGGSPGLHMGRVSWTGVFWWLPVAQKTRPCRGSPPPPLLQCPLDPVQPRTRLGNQLAGLVITFASLSPQHWLVPPSPPPTLPVGFLSCSLASYVECRLLSLFLFCFVLKCT